LLLAKNLNKQTNYFYRNNISIFSAILAEIFVQIYYCFARSNVNVSVAGRLQVRLDGTEPGSTWSASPAAPVGWKTVDGCLKGTGMIL